MSAIHILVLNFNGRALLEECLPSVWEACQRSPLACRLTVVDNESGDDSRAWLKKNLPEVEWLSTGENRILFSYNHVLPRIKEDLVLLLNNDIKLDPDSIAPLFNALREDPDAFAASPRHLDFKGRYNGGMNRCGRRGSLAWAGPAYAGAEEESRRRGRTLFTGNGLFRRDKILALGGFDELYAPMGWEDADLCTRAWARGWATHYVPESVIHHKSSASIAKAFSLHSRRALGFRNGTLWLLRNAPLGQLLAALAWFFPTLLLCALTGRWAQIDGLLRALFRMPRALGGRSGGSTDWWNRFDDPAERMA